MAHEHTTRHPFGQWQYDPAQPVTYCECPCNNGATMLPEVQHNEGFVGCWVNEEDEATATSGQVPCRTLCLACVGNKHDYGILDMSI